MADSHETDKLWEMIKSIEIAMMVTDDGTHLRGRPMAVAQKAFDGSLWFFTRAHAPKVDEVADEERVNLSFTNPSKQDYVSVSGRASLVRDPEAVAQHWSESMRVWFPKGKNDPEIALLRVDVEQAEYWDAPSSKMLHAYGYVKAVLTGASPDPGGHRKMSVG